MYVVENLRDAAGPGSRDTIGGRPILPAGEDWPECYCGARMVLFFQLDVPPDIPRFGGDHLLVFQCPVHNDAARINDAGSSRLPERYGETPMVRGHPSPFWRIMLHCDPTGPADAEEPHLLGCELVLRPEYETVTMWLDETRARYATDDEMIAAEGVGRNQFKVGGLPCWLQDPVAHRCAYGAEMVFLCGLPEDIGFPRRPGQPEQPHTSDPDCYVLFLGVAIHLFACPEHCHPAAVWPVLQH